MELPLLKDRATDWKAKAVGKSHLGRGEGLLEIDDLGPERLGK